MQLVKVLNPAGASANLASLDAIDASQSWIDVIELKRFVCAFPPSKLNKRPRDPVE
jgi:hypothetical protein